MRNMIGVGDRLLFTLPRGKADDLQVRPHRTDKTRLAQFETLLGRVRSIL